MSLAPILPAKCTAISPKVSPGFVMCPISSENVFARIFARCLNPNLIAPGIDVVRFFAAREHR